MKDGILKQKLERTDTNILFDLNPIEQHTTVADVRQWLPLPLGDIRQCGGEKNAYKYSGSVIFMLSRCPTVKTLRINHTP